MVISRERYLDDSSRYLVTLSLASRTLETHGWLSSLPAEVQQQVGDVLTRALDSVQHLLHEAPAGPGGVGETAHFGCGT